MARLRAGELQAVVDKGMLSGHLVVKSSRSTGDGDRRENLGSKERERTEENPQEEMYGS